MRLSFLCLLMCAFGFAYAGERSSLRELLGGSAVEEEPLPPERAFVMRTQALGKDAISITFTPAPTYYLYRSKFAFAVEGASKVAIKQVDLPKGEMKQDAIFGHTEVYYDSVRALLTLKNAAVGQEVELKVTLQGCTERGLCYPPDTRKVKVKLPKAGAAAPLALDAGA